MLKTLAMQNSNKKIKIAIIYFCYNRVDHLNSSLPKILEFKKELPLFIFCDGPTKHNTAKTTKVRNYVQQITNETENCKTTLRKKNLGLANNVISGVNEVFNLGYDAVSVLEDDCIPYSNYFDYMEKTLNYYESFENVMHVSGFGMPLKNKPMKDTYITPYPCSWGWGTWKSKWVICDFEDQAYYQKILSNTYLTKMFNWSGKSFSYFLTLQAKGEVNSWLIRWYAHIFKSKGVCVWATDTKLKNVGFDGSGQHKVKHDIYNQRELISIDEYDFQNKTTTFDKGVIKQFRQFFMGPNIIDKIKTVLYLKTGLLFEKTDDVSKHYNH